MNSKGWIECKLEDIADIEMGQSPKSEFYNFHGEGTPFLQGNRTFGYLYPSFDTYTTDIKKLAYKGDVLMSVRAPVGDLNIAPLDLCIGRGISAIRMKNGNNRFLYYLLKSNTSNILKNENGSVFGSINGTDLRGLKVSLPEQVIEQQNIASVLSNIDDKIELNNRINKTLEEMAQAIFKSWFVDFDKNKDEDFQRFSDWEIPLSFRCGKSESFFDISIGKTPPRKESEWFSHSSKDMKWLSISDMGDSGVFVHKTSEYLTRDAIKKFNVQIVPPKTVMLSFKLTIGRVSISEDEMVTNEAIAHFKSTDPYIMEYIYLFLKNYEFSKLGSTSSIATATNSKVIKGMPIYIPKEDLLKSFHDTVLPLFNKIKLNQKENIVLSELRDSLLPKLMSGEIRVPLEEGSNA